MENAKRNQRGETDREDTMRKADGKQKGKN